MTIVEPRALLSVNFYLSDEVVATGTYIESVELTNVLTGETYTETIA